MVFRNYYQCDACPNEWGDEMLSVSHSWCPCCDGKVEPYSSERRTMVFVARDDIAPKSDRWYATDRELDLGVPTGHGATPLGAIDDLLWRLNVEDIEPTACDIVWRS